MISISQKIGGTIDQKHYSSVVGTVVKVHTFNREVIGGSLDIESMGVAYGILEGIVVGPKKALIQLRGLPAINISYEINYAELYYSGQEVTVGRV